MDTSPLTTAQFSWHWVERSVRHAAETGRQGERVWGRATRGADHLFQAPSAAIEFAFCFVVGFNWIGNGGHELETSRSVAFLLNMDTQACIPLSPQRKLLARSDRVKCMDLHTKEAWMLVSLYNGNVHIWNHESQVGGYIVMVTRDCECKMNVYILTLTHRHW